MHPSKRPLRRIEPCDQARRPGPGADRRGPQAGGARSSLALALVLVAGCTAGSSSQPGEEVEVEFVFERHGGLCSTPDGGGLCRLAITVRDDGTWSAEGTPEPDPSRGSVPNGTASELAAIVDEGWAALTARAFTETCPTAYDGSEQSYQIRRLPRGPDAARADAAIRTVRSCEHDLTHPAARAVVERIEAQRTELGLPP